MQNIIDLNENQKVAAEYSDQHILVLAGAGTGKTMTIIARAAHLFTEKRRKYYEARR
jgi:superfamily I DNA/RNA helicase